MIIKRDKPSLRIVNMLEEESLDDIRNWDTYVLDGGALQVFYSS